MLFFSCVCAGGTGAPVKPTAFSLPSERAHARPRSPRALSVTLTRYLRRTEHMMGREGRGLKKRAKYGTRGIHHDEEGFREGESECMSGKERGERGGEEKEEEE